MPNHLSRRGLLRGAAALGAVGVAGAVAVQSFDSSASAASESAAGEPIVAHLRDAGTGELDLYVGTRRVRVRDAELAARLSAAAR
ncbi:hypothetical protein GCM10010174_25550 [Kutzneria viridogrisea]|uniref:Nitrous oxide reductase n=2 Tax=Kutzneria TaxID=43356 RepID=A0ABR6BPM6_9PSEU|nr:twin-arginine translocation signal domain-containing protein [Kutzneria albida]AHH95941.1 putative secreted protein [Kutzneria albida DSM 43870]MBA8928858.1 nitrous oxide reductase [Kutzneria viridogrisea]